MWPNLLRKTAITTNFYFPLEEESLCLRKNLLSVNSVGWNIDATFCNVCSDFYMEKTDYYRVYQE